MTPVTYRCLGCRALYVDPTPGGHRYYHVCPQLTAGAAGGTPPRRPGARDERIIQDRPGGPGRPLEWGAGRELLAWDDALTGTTVAQLEALFAAPALEVQLAPPAPAPVDSHRAFPAPAE